jgi:hypothetical protein
MGASANGTTWSSVRRDLFQPKAETSVVGEEKGEATFGITLRQPFWILERPRLNMKHLWKLLLSSIRHNASHPTSTIRHQQIKRRCRKGKRFRGPSSWPVPHKRGRPADVPAPLPTAPTADIAPSSTSQSTAPTSYQQTSMSARREDPEGSPVCIRLTTSISFDKLVFNTGVDGSGTKNGSGSRSRARPELI